MRRSSGMGPPDEMLRQATEAMLEDPDPAAQVIAQICQVEPHGFPERPRFRVYGSTSRWGSIGVDEDGLPSTTRVTREMHLTIVGLDARVVLQRWGGEEHERYELAHTPRTGFASDGGDEALELAQYFLDNVGAFEVAEDPTITYLRIARQATRKPEVRGLLDEALWEIE